MTMTEPKQKIEKAATVSPDQLVALTYPERAGTTRRIHKLWDGAWRINWHDQDSGYAVVRSVFVQIEDGKLAERN
jgi:hypothetical protein